MFRNITPSIIWLLLVALGAMQLTFLGFEDIPDIDCVHRGLRPGNS